MEKMHAADSLRVAPPGIPFGSYHQYFPYYKESDPTMPNGAHQISNGLLYIGEANNSNATASIIFSDREDNRVCICTAGHIISGPLGFYNRDVYMKYLGRQLTVEEDPTQMRRGVPSSFKSNMQLELVAQTADVNNSALGDWAIFLGYPDELPVRQFSKNGYLFNPDLYTTAAADGGYSVLSHPMRLDQRVIDSLYYDPFVSNLSSAIAVFKPHPLRAKPGAIAHGSSGAPLFSSWVMSGPIVGIVFGPGIFSERTMSGNYILDRDRNKFSQQGFFNYSDEMRVTKMTTPALMAAIKKHCWKKSDSLNIESKGLYKQGIDVDNSARVDEFNVNRSINTQSDLNAAADQSYNIGNISGTLVKAATLAIKCQIQHEGAKNFLRCLATEIILEAGFSYVAEGQNQFDANTVVPELLVSGMRKGAQDGEKQNPGNVGEISSETSFQVYPNPAEDGIFQIVFPSDKVSCFIEVYTIEGKSVIRKDVSIENGRYKLDLSGLSRGSYLLALYNRDKKHRLFSKVLIYQ